MTNANIQSEAITSIQKAALENYCDGDFAYIAELSDAEVTKEIERLRNQDGFLRYILLELSPKEGCEDAIEAVGRLATMISDLQKISAAIESLD